MKNVLDHRILIPKAPDTIWQYISDLSSNANWQTDCAAVSFLTSRHTGVGVRWRYRTPSGHDCVVETTAWYEGLGYEYTYIDGVPFDENRGRIRLQEIAEGTIVQWTFAYDMRGMLGGVRNTLSTRRQVENTMTDSLRMLWRKLNQPGAGEPMREAKSLIRDAPGYEERARYKPRHPSARLDNETEAQPWPESSSVQPPAVIIPEPPVADEDTRPSVRVIPPETAVPLSVRSPFAPPEPTAPPPDIAVGQTPEPAQPLPSEPAAQAEPSESAVPEPTAPPPDIAIGQTPEPAQPPAQVSAEAITPQPPDEPSAPALSPQPAEPAQVEPLEPISPDKLAKIDTREVSVFDLFGLPKPSETQQMQAVTLPDETASAPAAEPTVSEPTTGQPLPERVGLRLRLRRKRVHLRRPS